MYAALLKDTFPQDERNGFFKAPQLPAVKLGRLLIRDKRISSPNDVIALHLHEGTFSSAVVIFTATRCFYPDGAFALEEVRDAEASGSKVLVTLNQKGQLNRESLIAKNDQAAGLLAAVLRDIARKDLKAEAAVQRVYEGYSDTELSWLNLRDEIMRTIDMLYDRFNDGKLSLIEYEEKKDELLKRL
ncbi:MAG: hypothetical protein NW241_18120 [Bacteroidia bacterium]|nr:hypothetical protein [Bacteroidia bacterium]